MDKGMDGVRRRDAGEAAWRTGLRGRRIRDFANRTGFF
jgi:hypothetical protein